MPQKILINSRTSGRFKRETINGRSHLVTSMMPIRGDTTMNRIFYPDKQVANSFEQLDLLPAPNGHPTVNGIHVPAFHPVANNTHNIGGFIRNPRKKGKRVFAEFLLDETVANQTDEGREVIKRIENAEKIGVSTGLTIANVLNKAGKDDFGKEYDREGEGFNFDHVAILLNETAAGEHAGTELVMNEDGEDIIICNLDFDDEDALTRDDVEAMIEAAKDTEQPQTTIQTNEGDPMKDLLILSIIANTANEFTADDREALEAKTDVELIDIVSAKHTEETARNALSVHGFDFDGYAVFETNKEGFDAYMAAAKTAHDAKVAEIVANTEYTAEMLDGKTDLELDVINKLIDKSVDRAAPGSAPEITNNADDTVVCDYS